MEWMEWMEFDREFKIEIQCYNQINSESHKVICTVNVNINKYKLFVRVC